MSPTKPREHIKLHDCDDDINGVILKNRVEESVEPTREQWSRKLDFLLAVVGFAVGLGNIWRFPYLCYKNGGGAFFIPYFVCMVCGGIPTFILEVSLGQYMSQGGIGVWKICPLAQGLGLSTTVITLFMNVYYIIILAWSVYYCCWAFSSELPWASCNNTWNTDRCRTVFSDVEQNCSWKINLTDDGALSSASNISSICGNASLTRFVDPAVEFWERGLLEISPGVDQPGGLVWQLVLALLVVWLVCYFCVWKGIRWSGKVVYVTATFPYFVLTALVIRGLSLPGSLDGIIYFLKPDFTRLADSQVWLDAGTQIFFSYAIGLGIMAALGSYNKFNNNCYRDCLLIAGVNSCTSIYAGLAIFSVLGFMAQEQGVNIHKVVDSGPGLVFIAYPKAITQMPFPQLWAVLFFIMLVMVGLDSQFVGLEGIITLAMDKFPALRSGHRKQIFVALYCLLSFLFGLTMVTRGGMYVFQLFDYYAASGIALLWVCFFQSAVISWVYGARRFHDNIELMLGFRLGRWLMVCWTILTPLVTGGIFIFMWANFKVLKYNNTYVYPAWAQGLGMCMAFASMICIPVYGLLRFVLVSGSLRQRWVMMTTPVLIQERIPRHWADYEFLTKVSKCASKKDILFSRRPPWTDEELSLSLTRLNDKHIL